MYERLYTKNHLLYTIHSWKIICIQICIQYLVFKRGLKDGICEVRDLNPRPRAWEARTLTSLGQLRLYVENYNLNNKFMI